MKAIVYDDFGSPDVLRFEDIDRPSIAPGEVLIRVHAASLNPFDWHYLRGMPYVMRLMGFGLRKPKERRVLGSDMAGVVAEVGEDVVGLKPGDEVYAEVGFGACAEYVVFQADKLGLKPSNTTFESAAAVPMAAQTALVGLRDKVSIRPGHKVLVNGASGGVGTFAVQIAAAFGAEVTGVCSTRNVELVRSIGASEVIDYSREDFTQGPNRYDVVFDAVGNHSLTACRRVLLPEGTLLAPGGGGGNILGPLKQQLKMTLLSPLVSANLKPVNDKPNQDLDVLRDLIEADEIVPVIDRVFSLDEAPAALRYLEEGHARGKVVVEVSQS